MDPAEVQLQLRREIDSLRVLIPNKAVGAFKEICAREGGVLLPQGFTVATFSTGRRVLLLLFRAPSLRDLRPARRRERRGDDLVADVPVLARSRALKGFMGRVRRGFFDVVEHPRCYFAPVR